MILGIETSAAQCAVALVDGARTVAKAEPMERGHAEALFPMIDAVLAEAGATLADLTRIGVCTGPGSFTGVRIGVAAARGLALGRGIPVVGITRFAALAHGHAGPRTIRIAGRGGTVFEQAFGADGTPDGPPRLTDGEAPDPLADPATIARLAARAPADAPLPAPLYLRGADAALPSAAPPVLLD